MTRKTKALTRSREVREAWPFFFLRELRVLALGGCLLVLAGPAAAQAINHDETRLLSAPNGRPGCYAPLVVVFDAPQGAKTALVESISEGVVLTRQVNIDKPGRITTRLPWLVARGSKVRVTIEGQSDEFTPPMPTRPQPPSYGRIYAAVFTLNVAMAREWLAASDELMCDFFSDTDAINDWRMLDGYDAVIVLWADAPNWELAFGPMLNDCSSLGLSRLITTTEPWKAPNKELVTLGGVPFATDKTGSYHCELGKLTGAPKPAAVVVQVVRDHRWRGDVMPPAGPAPSRAIAEPFERGWLHPQGQEPPSAPAWFFALAGLVLLVTVLGPVVGARITARAWPAPLAVTALAGVIGWLGALQSGPPATVELFTVESRGGNIASTRSYVTCEAIPGAPESWTLNLDAEGPRRLVRAAPARVGCRAWVVDTPQTKPLERSKAVDFKSGKIEDLIFRDYAAKARRGQTHFDEGQARILDWWLERFAYRGCNARIAPAQPGDETPADWPNVYWRRRGAISVTPLR